MVKKVFTTMEKTAHEQVLFCRDHSTKLKAIIAIHSTILGPALGGCRMWDYENEEDALKDVLRLSRGMTYKAALAGLPLGGGKSVILGDPETYKNKDLLRSFGRYVDRLGGSYITAQDVSITSDDLLHIRQGTKYVVGLPVEAGGLGSPSPMTALGVFSGIRAAVKHRFGKDSLRGVRVAVQGYGNVGTKLCQLLHKEGVRLWVNDIDTRKEKKAADTYDAQIVDGDALLSAEVDVLSPCALGGLLDDRTIPKLRAKIVAGGANNQLAIEDKHGEMLRQRGILYAPDYIINAGGLIGVSYELEGIKQDVSVEEKTKAIYDTLSKIFSLAEKRGESTRKISDRLAEEKICMATKRSANTKTLAC